MLYGATCKSDQLFVPAGSSTFESPQPPYNFILSFLIPVATNHSLPSATINNKVPVCCVVILLANCILTIKRRQGLTYSNSKLCFLEKSQDLLGIGATCSHVGCVQMHFTM
ncbi:hypothetical protein, unlikely [Trypanosoma brucei gambiense DAL972]|uniref:T. brucei spp.-specific protein n=1 Tax=Trypanosoma brucei gambiense (strain MHOM/CI/86/DAL972) TaxID=679716 RepID=C9ZQ03_TRYB9|nr:hypothetical protein, unlikely [Trypanosoma brucei gambiense DAL972]CBH11481.1 hypothetical protein, unlikely [Trypanosoma brucei gambiense DAL972]|eukprot:XP_011773768.1 hypothetical protein, unlikely [Trypanosoma brucei gambiense DAL972]